MAGDEKIKCEVIHPKLNLRVEGKLQRIPIGTELTLTKAQFEAFGPKKVRKAGEKKQLDASGSGDGEKAISKMTVDELKAKLGEAQIEIPGGANKATLVELLQKHLDSQQ